MVWRILALIAPVLLCSLDLQRDPEKDTSATVQANYIYNIAKLVEWKDASQRSGNFVIGIVGGANLYQELIKKYATKTIGDQPIEIRKLPRTADVGACHMLYVGRTDLALMPGIYKNLAGKGTLIITEYQDALEDGAVVNFISVENIWRYEISISNARDHGLQVGSILKQLAHRVEE